MKFSVISQIGLKWRFLWVEGLACASVSLRLLITVSRASLQSSLRCELVLEFGYFAAFSNADGSKLSDAENDKMLSYRRETALQGAL